MKNLDRKQMNSKSQPAQLIKQHILDEAVDNMARNTAGKHYVDQLDTTQTAQYVTDMILELRNLARSAGLQQLTYYLEMAFYEAYDQSNKPK